MPDQIPMPIEEAVLDMVPLGTVQTVQGPRARVVVVAVRREMVERVVGAVRDAGLELEGLDLSAFGMVRAVDQVGRERPRRCSTSTPPASSTWPSPTRPGCLFTRAAAGGIDAMAATLSERRGLTLEHARQWMTHVGLATPLEEVEGDAELVGAARPTLEEGVHQIADTVRNSLNFYRMQENAEAVDHAVLTGPGVDIPGLAERLAELLRMPVSAVDRPQRATASRTPAA